MVFRSFEVVLNYMLQIFLFAAPFYQTDVAGIVMVMLAVFAMGAEKPISRRIGCRVRGRNIY